MTRDMDPEEPFATVSRASCRVREVLRRHRLVLGLVAVAGVTLGDRTGTVAAMGRWLADRDAPEAIIFLIFLLSGLSLVGRQVLQGLADLPVLFLSLLSVFVVAPVLALSIAMLPLTPGVRVGLFLVAVMPTTLSTGVVMTAAAGGNPAAALLCTVAASWLAIFTVPVSLELLLGSSGPLPGGNLDKWALAFRIAFLVVVPLIVGLAAKPFLGPILDRRSIRAGVLNQGLVLAMVWIALSRSRAALVASPSLLGETAVLSLFYHALVLAAIFCMVRLFRIGAGRREAVVFMGGQKTLPLSVLLQTTLFPQYGEALVVCVVHHLVHLVMDGYLVGKMVPRWKHPGVL